jgi:hypothetical protein
MNAAPLAARMIARRRRMMLRAAIPLGFAAFVFVLAAALLTEVGLALRELERTELSGELGIRRAGGLDDTITTGLDRLPPELYVSHAWVTPAIVGGEWGTGVAEVWFTDIGGEMEFRGLQPPPPESEIAGLSGGLISTARGGTPDGLEQPTVISELTVTIPGIQTTATILAHGMHLAERRMVVMVPWQLLPRNELPQPYSSDDTPGRDPAGGDTTIGAEVIRVRGAEPLGDAEIKRLTAELGLQPTGWAEIARHRMRDLWWLLAAVAGLLYVAGGAASAPSVGIVVRRYAAEFQLLTATGYPRAYIRRLVASLGAIGAGLAATVGSVVAALILTVASMRGGVDPSFLPLYWLERNPELGMLAPGPPILPAIAAIVVAAAVGALSALPASRVVATMKSDRGLWG